MHIFFLNSVCNLSLFYYTQRYQINYNAKEINPLNVLLKKQDNLKNIKDIEKSFFFYGYLNLFNNKFIYPKNTSPYFLYLRITIGV